MENEKVIELNDKAKNFLKEYSELCKKHGLMVVSDFEKVTIGAYEKDLWQIEESTIEWITRFPQDTQTMFMG